ncbi:MAG: right-handed parallel beta-helix repeat-containing protein [Candidatus Eisenbacteria bacterium]
MRCSWTFHRASQSSWETARFVRHSLSVGIFCGALLSTSADGAIVHVPGDAPTIQAGIDLATTTDTVLVATGTYSGPGNRDIEFGKDLVLLSEGGATVTIVDCEQSGRGLYFKYGESAATAVEGFTIRNGAVVDTGKGGGIACTGNSSPTIRNCVVENCTSEAGGAGIYIGGSAPSFVGCDVVGNATNGRGGGVWSYQSTPVFDSCRLSQNRAVSGYGGGGVFDQESGSQYIDCEITSNEAPNGAGLRTLLSSPSLSGCLVAGNRASGTGGGLALAIGANAEIVACTIADNHAGSGGGVGGGPANFVRTIVWGNCATTSGDQIHLDGGTSQFACCDVDANGLDGGGDFDLDADCIFDDPIFCAPRDCEDAPVSPADYGLATSSPCLESTSPCGALIGARGESCAVPLVSGACCLDWAACEILYETECVEAGGAYSGDDVSCSPNPCPGACCFSNHACAFLSEDECSSANGDCWRGGVSCDPSPCPLVYRVPSEFPDIQSAVDVACPGTTVLVADGIFDGAEHPGNQRINPHGKDIRIVSENGPASTIIELHGRGFSFESGETPACVLQGFTIRDGAIGEGSGGGIFCWASSPTIVDCVIEDCEALGLARGQGGGVACVDGASPTFLGCTIRNCFADEDGEGGGGGLYVFDASPVFRECEITDNICGDHGGGVYIGGDSQASLVDCVITRNIASSGGGLAIYESPAVVIDGCTIAGNSARSAGGIRTDDLMVQNTVVWNNCAEYEGDQILAIGEVTCVCSDVDSSGVGGPGFVFYDQDTIFTDPLFCASEPCDTAPDGEEDHSLEAASPCLPLASPCGALIGALGVGCPVSDVEPEVTLPTQLQLRGPWPNPTASSSRFVLDLPSATPIRARLVDVSGAVVAKLLDTRLPAGTHVFDWPESRDVSVTRPPRGVYWVRVEGDGWSFSRAITIVD